MHWNNEELKGPFQPKSSTNTRVAGIIFIVKLCSIETLEVPYLTPISPLYPNLIKESILKRPRNKMKQRPNYLGQQDTIRMGDNNEN